MSENKLSKLEELERRAQDQLKKAKAELRRAKQVEAKKEREEREKWLLVFAPYALKKLSSDMSGSTLLYELSEHLSPSNYKIVEFGLKKEGVLDCES